MRNTNATSTALQLATQQEQEHKERGEKTELQTTPNDEGKAKNDHRRREKTFSNGARLATHSTPPGLSHRNPLEAIKHAPGPRDSFCMTPTTHIQLQKESRTTLPAL
jgi:hypothetical protein